jgi:hypothetical protein
MAELNELMSRFSVGTLVRVKPLWNETERWPNQFEVPTKVLGWRRVRNSQTGLLLVVRTRNGARREIDAGWFDDEAAERHADGPDPDAAVR